MSFQRPIVKTVPQTAKSAKRKLTPLQIATVTLITIVFAGMLAITLAKAWLGVPNASLPTLYAVGKGVAIYDRFNKYVCSVYADRDRKPVPLNEVSNDMKSALLAAEDHNFYKHHGIDLIGIGRAVVSNAHAGRVVEGGSTITQQLVRNLYLDINDRSIKRKVLEALLTVDVENNYSKSKILETYLNEVYFGNGVYGIERASQVYFNKHAAQLSLGESAFIAGLIKAPSDLGAPMNRDAALRRQHEVLDKMVAYNLIGASKVELAKSQSLRFNPHPSTSVTPYPYYVSSVLRVLQKQLTQEQIWGKGLRVYTCLDQSAQKLAESTLNKGINAAPAGINQGALVSQSVRDGSVIALVGGVGDYRNHQFNRALARHTVGSSFKPFVYLSALIYGALLPNSAVDDSPITFNLGFGHQYSPKNYDGRYLGTISVRDALALSRNVCSIRIADAVGITKVIDTARAAGISAPLDKNLTLALGSCAVSPLEMATAYGTLARYGRFIEPELIRRVDDAQGQELHSFKARALQTLPQEQVCELVDVLQDVVQRGTGTQAKLPNIAVAGKTGTADKARDIWFVGFTPDTVTSVWGGNDRDLAVRGNVTGGMVMAKIWHDYMQQYYKTHPLPTGGFIPPRTPLSTQAALSINKSVIMDAEQYEEGVKPAEGDDAVAPDAQLMQPVEVQSHGEAPSQAGSPAQNAEAQPQITQPSIPLQSQSQSAHESNQPATGPQGDRNAANYAESQHGNTADSEHGNTASAARMPENFQAGAPVSTVPTMNNHQEAQSGNVQNATPPSAGEKEGDQAARNTSQRLEPISAPAPSPHNATAPLTPGSNQTSTEKESPRTLWGQSPDASESR